MKRTKPNMSVYAEVYSKMDEIKPRIERAIQSLTNQGHVGPVKVHLFAGMRHITVEVSSGTRTVCAYSYRIDTDKFYWDTMDALQGFLAKHLGPGIPVIYED